MVDNINSVFVANMLLQISVVNQIALCLEQFGQEASDLAGDIFVRALWWCVVAERSLCKANDKETQHACR
jgi:hypothetical protein